MGNAIMCSKAVTRQERFSSWRRKSIGFPERSDGLGSAADSALIGEKSRLHSLTPKKAKQKRKVVLTLVNNTFGIAESFVKAHNCARGKILVDWSNRFYLLAAWSEKRPARHHHHCRDVFLPCRCFVELLFTKIARAAQKGAAGIRCRRISARVAVERWV